MFVGDLDDVPARAGVRCDRRRRRARVRRGARAAPKSASRSCVRRPPTACGRAGAVVLGDREPARRQVLRRRARGSSGPARSKGSRTTPARSVSDFSRADLEAPRRGRRHRRLMWCKPFPRLQASTTAPLRRATSPGPAASIAWRVGAVPELRLAVTASAARLGVPPLARRSSVPGSDATLANSFLVICRPPGGVSLWPDELQAAFYTVESARPVRNRVARTDGEWRHRVRASPSAAWRRPPPRGPARAPLRHDAVRARPNRARPARARRRHRTGGAARALAPARPRGYWFCRRP